MARRSGQNGYIEKKRGWYHVRFRIDVPGQEKRPYKSIPLCPISGPGRLSKAERKRKAREVVEKSGANSIELFRKVEAINHGSAFEEQADWWLKRLQSRARKPVAPATVTGHKSYLKNWINPAIETLPLVMVNNLAVKGLVAKMVAANVSPKMIINVVQVIKGVVASAINQDGEELYPRKWNHDFMDLPIITEQHKPSFTADMVTAIVASAKGRYRVLYALCAATGMRIGEALGLEIDKHIVDNGSTLNLRQKAWNGQIHDFLKTGNAKREIDLHSSIAEMLVEFIGERKAGLVFCTESGKTISPSNILSDSLHPILKKLGYAKAGAHAFRRFRATWLRRQRTPEDLIRFWLGHANKSITDNYSLLKEDVEFRKKIAEQVGIGFQIPTKKPDVAPTLDVLHPHNGVVSFAVPR
ncbi:MAG TPA: site-specific integrase [Candidatus Acidoferrum sp.]|nr:site-specific integrase [Candidatus Acidoferrum sp.]